MTVLSKQEVPRPTLAKETVTVEALGGDVVVQAIMLSDRLDIAVAKGGNFTHVAEMLARCVVDREGKPIFTAPEWEVWGGDNDDAAFALFEVCKKVCKLGKPTSLEEKRAGLVAALAEVDAQIAKAAQADAKKNEQAPS